MPTREDSWLGAAGAGCATDWAGVEKLLESDVSPDAVISGLEQDYWGPATGAHFWGAPTCPVRRPVATAVAVIGDPSSWKKAAPAGWQEKAKTQYSDFYNKKVSASCWAAGPLVDDPRPHVPVRPQKNEAAMITGVITTDASASMISPAQQADIARAASQDLASGMGHTRVRVDEISGPQLRLHVRLSASWGESDPLFTKLRQSCMKLSLAKMQDAYRKATGLSDSQVSVIGSSCMFSAPRPQQSLMGPSASDQLGDWSHRNSPSDLAWACAAGSVSQDALARSIQVARSLPSTAGPRPAVAPRVSGVGGGAQTVSPAPPPTNRLKPKTKVPIGTTAAPQTDEEKKALAVKRQALLAGALSKVKPTGKSAAGDKGPAKAAAPAPALAPLPKTEQQQKVVVKTLLTVGTYFRGGINFIGESSGERHFENYELMIDSWDSQTKMLRGWHNHSSRLREIRRQCSVRCWIKDKQPIVQIKDELMTCKGYLKNADTFEGEVTLPSFTGKFVLTRDEFGPSD